MSFFLHLFFRYFYFCLLKSLNISVFLACSVSKQKCPLQHFYYSSYIFVLLCFIFLIFVLGWCFGFCSGSDWWCVVLDISPDFFTSIFITLSVQKWVPNKFKTAAVPHSISPLFAHFSYVYQPLCLEGPWCIGPCPTFPCLPFPSVFFLWIKALCWEIPMYVEITMELLVILHSH